MGRAARETAGVEIVTGDTKVVENGKGDGLFINTSGIGLVPRRCESVGAAQRASRRSRSLLSGYLGLITASRFSRGPTGRDYTWSSIGDILQSDSAPLHTLVREMLAASNRIRCFRDPTRGGLSSTANEIAASSKVGIELIETAIPIREEVRGACEMLGLDPLYVANEGKLVAIVDPADSDAVLCDAMRRHPLGADAATSGPSMLQRSRARGMVTIRTAFGTTRIVDMLAGDQLPRIC